MQFLQSTYIYCENLTNTNNIADKLKLIFDFENSKIRSKNRNLSQFALLIKFKNVFKYDFRQYLIYKR